MTAPIGMRFGASVILACAVAWGSNLAAAAPFEWKHAAPESQGMSSERLDALRDDLARRATDAFLVVRNDTLVYEWYAKGRPADEKRGTASLAKALVGGVSLAAAITDGKIAIDDLAAGFVPAWKADPKKSAITVRHLGSHTSGLTDSTTPGVAHVEQPGWNGKFWQRLPPPDDPFTIARDKVPVAFPPGERLVYSNPGLAMMSYCVTAAIRGGPRADIRSLLRERIMRPIGVADRDWSCGYGQTFEVDGLPLVASWGGGAFTPRATARIGRLLLHEGNWDGRQLLSREAVRQVTGNAGLPGHCGMGFWTNGDGRYPKLPRDAYYGAGAGDQLLLVIPSLRLIMVRNGQTLAPEPADETDVRARFHDQRVRILFDPLVDAIVEKDVRTDSVRTPPYPPSSVISEIQWEPPETIVRRAEGSDNWPMTWGDDDDLYTAYGDGQGFDPRVPRKLSLGLARIEGGPELFRGVNLRSPTVELVGDGRQGKKSSGILMVDGVLYLWVRNAENSQLAWSRDHGQTWQWADWRFTTSFGCPTFLNFGKNYAGARDEFVYVYSHDAGSAYDVADRMVMARVKRDQILHRDAYEFLASVDDAGTPVWTPRIEDRGAAFTHPKSCSRSSVSFHAAAKRYLWVQMIPHPAAPTVEARFVDGLAIYDAPEPWGPWATAFFAPQWDVHPGESACLPTKWMEPDSGKVALVFSGNDSFSVRQATLQFTRPNAPPR